MACVIPSLFTRPLPGPCIGGRWVPVAHAHRLISIAPAELKEKSLRNFDSWYDFRRATLHSFAREFTEH